MEAQLGDQHVHSHEKDVHSQSVLEYHTGQSPPCLQLSSFCKCPLNSYVPSPVCKCTFLHYARWVNVHLRLKYCVSFLIHTPMHLVHRHARAVIDATSTSVAIRAELQHNSMHSNKPRSPEGSSKIVLPTEYVSRAPSPQRDPTPQPPFV